MVDSSVAFNVRGQFVNGASFDDLFVPVVPQNCQNASVACTLALCMSCAGVCFKTFANGLRVADDDEPISVDWLLDGLLLGVVLGSHGAKVLEIDEKDN